MGYILKGDFDTSFGKLSEIYCRIESLYFSKPTGYCTFSYTYWPYKQASDVHTPVFEGEGATKAIQMVDTQIIMYNGSENFTDILLPHSIKVFAGTEKIIEEPVYTYEEYTEEVPYVSFDENGDEILKHKTVTREKKVQTSIQMTTKNMFNSNLLNNLYSYGYDNLKKVLLQWIHQDSLVQV